MTTIEEPKPSEYIEICPDLAALVDLAWNNHLMRSSETALLDSSREHEAISGSIAIGRGSSFLITRRPETNLRQSEQQAKPQKLVTHRVDKSRLVKKSQSVVYKIARVGFDKQGDPFPGQQVDHASVLLDLMVMSHRPIRKHENVIKLLGLAWGESGLPNACDIPVPVVEYADRGNLAEYQTSKFISVKRKTELLHDIASALVFLHKNSIAHGDIKSENILLQSHHIRGLIAKVSDFGFSVLGGQGHFNFLPRGTLLWAAPEIRYQMFEHGKAYQSDAYSYGLLFWRVMIDGADPLCRYYLSQTSGLKRLEDQDLTRLSDDDLRPVLEQDLVGQQALSHIWLPRYRAVRHEKNPRLRESTFAQKVLMGEEFDNECGTLCDKISTSTLKYKPSERNLEAALEALRRYTKLVEKPTSNPESVTQQPAYHILQQNAYTVSWNALRDIPPAVSNHIIKQKLCKLDARRVSGQRIADLAYGLACCHVSGMGSDRRLDLKKAKDLLFTAATNGSTGAQAAFPRFAKTIGFSLSGMDELLIKCAMWGSLSALEDLPSIDEAGYQKAKSFLRTNMCGVGAQLFRYWNPPWVMDKLKSLSFVENFLLNTPEKAQNIKVNPRGDGLLHAAASLAQFELVKTLVLRYGLDVNQCNAQGESPLLCALRSSNLDTVDWLLDHGAKVVSKSTYNHETPVHWLISVERSQSYRMAKRLLQDQEHRSCLTVWASRCKYASTLVSGYKDKWDNLCDGTPLHWAICRKRLDLVRILISYGADTTDYGRDSSQMTALELAAFLHEHEILRFLIKSRFPGPRVPYLDSGNRDVILKESSEQAITPRGLSHWIKHAINGCDNWKMLFRHGDNWKIKMEKTFKILGHELEFAHLNVGVDGQGRSPLNWAASRGFHEGVDMVLKYMKDQAHIDDSFEPGGWSPLFWAIHRDNKRMFHNLLDNDADIFQRVSDPNSGEAAEWTLLHQAAKNVIDGDLEICRELLDRGLKPDGVQDSRAVGRSQSPLSVAIEVNQFELADLLRQRGADINARFTSAGWQGAQLKYPCTILGRVIAANLRFSGSRLKYLLWPSKAAGEPLVPPNFVVDISSGLTVLHVAAMGALIFEEPAERDPDVASEILSLVLEKFEDGSEINAQTEHDKMTALHFAVLNSNLDAVKQLLEMDEIDSSLMNKAGETPLALMERLIQKRNSKGDEVLGNEITSDNNMEAIARLLTDHGT